MTQPLEQLQPVVVIGMHRSGTRLMTQLLERIGVFMGADQQADAESVAFMQINEAILHQCSAFWSEPMPAHFALSQDALVTALADVVRASVQERLTQYLGDSQVQPANASVLFGWKDPRNTFTLPVWRAVFPQLRVVHMIRHGVDVAASLSRRHSSALKKAGGLWPPAALGVIRDDALGVLSSRRGWTLEEAFTMWEQYVEKARLEMSLFDGAVELRFEDVLEQPQGEIQRLAVALGVPLPDAAAELAPEISAARAFAYRADRQLSAFAQSRSEVLARYAYTV